MVVEWRISGTDFLCVHESGQLCMYICAYISISKNHLKYTTRNYFLSLPVHPHLSYQKWQIIQFPTFLIANPQVCL